MQRDNSTAASMAALKLRFTNLGDLIRRDLDLSKTAVIDLGGEDGARNYSYAEIDAGANGVAQSLVAKVFERGDRVAILSANRAEYLIAYYGIMRAGLVAVPVNFKFPRQLIHFTLADSGARLVYCDGPRLPDCSPGLPALEFGDFPSPRFRGERVMERGGNRHDVAQAAAPYPDPLP